MRQLSLDHEDPKDTEVIDWFEFDMALAFVGPQPHLVADAKHNCWWFNLRRVGFRATDVVPYTCGFSRLPYDPPYGLGTPVL